MSKGGKDLGHIKTNQWSRCVKGVRDDVGEDEDYYYYDDDDDDNDHVVEKYNW